MHKIDTPNAVAVEPIASPAGTPGFFSDDGPNPTELSPEWCNAVQGELVAVIEGLGGNLVKGTNDQLWSYLGPRIGNTGTWDTPSAMVMKLGPANATKVEIADTGVDTEVKGALIVDAIRPKSAALALGGVSDTDYIYLVTKPGGSTQATLLDAIDGVTTDSVDTRTATTLAIGASTATKVEIADAGVETEVQGPMTVVGAFQAPVDVADEVVDTGPNDEITSNAYHGRFKTKSLTTAPLGSYAFKIKSDKCALGDLVYLNIEFYAGAGQPIVKGEVAGVGEIACGFLNVHPTDALNAAIYGSFSIVKKSV